MIPTPAAGWLLVEELAQSDKIGSIVVPEAAKHGSGKIAVQIVVASSVDAFRAGQRLFCSGTGAIPVVLNPDRVKTMPDPVHGRPIPRPDYFLVKVEHVAGSMDWPPAEGLDA